MQLLSPTVQHPAKNFKTACHDTFLHRLALAASANPSSKKTTQELSNNLQSVDKQGLTLDTTRQKKREEQCTQFHLKLLVEWTSSSSSSKSNQLLQNINGFCYIFFFGQILAKNEMEKIHYIRMIEHTFPFQIIWSGCPTHTTSKSVGESDY